MRGYHIYFGVQHVAWLSGEELASIEVPAPVQEPEFRSIPQSVLEGCTVIAADVETMDGSYSPEITQLSARVLEDSSDSVSFSKYVLPTKSISKQTAEMTGLTVGQASGHNVLLLHGKVVQSCSLTSTINEFLDWAGRTSHIAFYSTTQRL